MTQNYFVQAFRNQGIGNEKWQEVKRRIPGTDEYRYPKKKGLSRRTKPILIKTGELRRRVANSVVVADWERIKLLIDLPYAAAQNEGAKHIPARPFVRQTDQLTDKQVKLVEQYFNRIWD